MIASIRHRASLLEPLAKEVERAIEASAPESLSLLHELIYWYTVADDPTSVLFEDKTRSRLKTLALQVLLHHHIGKPELLAQALKGASPFTLKRVCYGIERVRKDAVGEPFSEWKDFAPTVLDAFRNTPDIMAAQVAAFVVHSSRRLHGPGCVGF